MVKFCPMNKSIVCGIHCPFLGYWINPKNGEKFLSCHRLHARIVLEDISLNGEVGPTETSGNPRSRL